MATAARTKENGYDFPLLKTPLRTPIRNGMLSSATLNDLSSYSNNTNPNKHLKFVNATSMHDLQNFQQGLSTPICLNKAKFATPNSIQRRRALGLVNHNSAQLSHPLTNDDLTKTVHYEKFDEPVLAAATGAHSEDDLPHHSKPVDSQSDTFDDLIPNDERIERLVRNFQHGVNLFAYYGGIENSIRCQSPVQSQLNVSTLLDMLDMFN